MLQSPNNNLIQQEPTFYQAVKSLLIVVAKFMGNCIVKQKKIIKIIKTDGEILEYKPPMKVHHVLSKFGAHALCDSNLLPVVQHLHPDTDLMAGGAYYLSPLLAVPPQKAKKTVQISSKVTPTDEGSGVLRIKLVISKQELQEMLQKGGVAVDNMMVSKLQINEKTNDNDDSLSADGRKRSLGWMPMLESIPEGV